MYLPNIQRKRNKFGQKKLYNHAIKIQKNKFYFQQISILKWYQSTRINLN